MTRRLVLGLMALSLIPPSASFLRAHEGHDHKVLGTVTMAASDHLMVKDRDGKTVTIQVTADTKVKPAMKVEEIKPGTRVVVTARMDKDKTLKARIVEVGAAPSGTK